MYTHYLCIVHDFIQSMYEYVNDMQIKIYVMLKIFFALSILINAICMHFPRISRSMPKSGKLMELFLNINVKFLTTIIIIRINKCNQMKM